VIIHSASLDRVLQKFFWCNCLTLSVGHQEGVLVLETSHCSSFKVFFQETYGGKPLVKPEDLCVTHTE